MAKVNKKAAPRRDCGLIEYNDAHKPFAGQHGQLHYTFLSSLRLSQRLVFLRGFTREWQTRFGLVLQNDGPQTLEQFARYFVKITVTIQAACHFEKRSDEKSTRTFDCKR
jgi:hypothetical protein